MKVLWKIALLLIVVLALFYSMDNRMKENKPLESPVKHGVAIPVPGTNNGQLPVQEARPDAGLSLFIGLSTEELISEKGKPDRIEPSEYGYDWWIYNRDLRFMVGVVDGHVNQVYTADIDSDVVPFKIGQEAQDIYRVTIVETEVVTAIDDNVYTFTLNGDDVKTRLLIEYEGVYAQLYIDSVDETLEAVRFIDPITLVLHQPYDMSYMGEIVTPSRPSANMQIEVDRSMERQIFELTNVYRKKHNANEVFSDYYLGEVARKHSEDMALQNYLSHESPEAGNLANRLKEAKIEQRKAGENIAANYVDAIEAVHGWLNSAAHRDVLLDKDFTHLGTGVYSKYYTQNFVRMANEEKRQR
ncbi:CAP domain-containing protein [Sporosarcina beigongshangi]|uniref:CAP domain-containing protein n=1 Tax=Sporosarcina beigongshangi TaxID=2782538 RepID=UPI001939E697|nr:CAP-associated domain-containing protein [Sporosarcina beigongshangi]